VTGSCDTSTNRCIACATDADCHPSKPVCTPATGICRPCQGDSECESEVCEPDGSCVPLSAVLFVDGNPVKCAQGDGTKSKPLCTLNAAVTALAASPSIAHILVRAGSYDEATQIVITNRSVRLRGEDRKSVIAMPSDPCQVILINGGAGVEVGISGFTIKGQVRINGQGVKVLLVDNEIEGVWQDCPGLHATVGTNVELRRNLIWNHKLGGVKLEKVQSYSVVNNFIVENGYTSTQSFGGVILQAQSATPSGPFLFVNNTVAENKAGGIGGVRCDSSQHKILNTILWKNSTQVNRQYSSLCDISYTTVSPGDLPSGPGNIQDNPGFVATGTVDAKYHLEPGPPDSPCKNAGIQNKETPLVDYDGDTRDGMPDHGADEVSP
jgi:hypothetical protein